MQYRPDIVVSSQSGTPIAIIEVKALPHTDVQTAARYLRSLLAHGVVPPAQFVLLVTPDTGYLWSSPAALLQEAPPSLIFSINRIVHHYLRSDETTMPVREIVLESIVRQWLADMADGIEADKEVTDRLQEVGFLSAVRDGLVTAQSVA